MTSWLAAIVETVAVGGPLLLVAVARSNFLATGGPAGSLLSDVATVAMVPDCSSSLREACVRTIMPGVDCCPVDGAAVAIRADRAGSRLSIRIVS